MHFNAFCMDFSNQIIPANLAGGLGAVLTSAGATRHQGTAQRGALPSAVIGNATVNSPIERWRTTAFISAKNLFDRLYLADRVRGMVPGAPRLIQGGFRITF